MVLVGWLFDLPAIASSGEAGGIAQKAIFYHPSISLYKNLTGTTPTNYVIEETGLLDIISGEMGLGQKCITSNWKHKSVISALHIFSRFKYMSVLRI
jgi:hypothetical protein